MHEEGGKMRRSVPLLLIVCLFLLFSCSSADEGNEDRLEIMAASFPSYDAARAVAGDLASITMLVPPGGGEHSYEPSIEDVIRISGSDLFIYNGGESDTWITYILSDLDGATSTFSLLENAAFTLYEDEENIAWKEENHEGHDHSHGRVLDEHVWTSPENEIAIIQALCEKIASLDEDNREVYESNAASYIDDIREVQGTIRDIVENGMRREIIVADRFPLLYFVTEFSLDYYAAYPGCSSESEPSAKTVAFLIDKVRKDGIPVVLHMELANTLLSEVVAEETGAAVMEFSSCHNVSKRVFDSGVTYVDLMRQNAAVLKEALN